MTSQSADSLVGLHWESGDTVFDLSLNVGTWQTTGNPSYTVKQTAVQSLADTLSELQGTRRLENVSNAADYGIEGGSFQVTASWSDGTQTTYTLGDATPFADGYYLQLSDSADVYTITTNLSSTFSKTLTDMASMESIQTAETITRVTVGSAFDITWREESNTVNPDQHWYDTVSGIALDDSKAQSIADGVASLRWDSLVSVSASEEELTEWQLDDEATQIICYDGDAASSTLLIGTNNRSGDYYARLPGSLMVYTVSADDLDSLMSANVQTLRATALLPLSWEYLAEAELTVDKGTYTILSPALDENQEVSTDTEEEMDGAEETETEDESDDAENQAMDLWETISGLQVNEWVENADQTVSPLFAIHAVSQEEKQITVAFYEYDAEKYLAVIDEGQAALISAEKIDSILRVVRLMVP